MSFDENIDKLKKELLDKRLSPEDMIQATQELRDELNNTINSKRLEFEYDIDDELGPRVGVFYKDMNFHIGTVWIQPDGSVGFSSESEYFPPLMASDTRKDFLKDAQEFLSEGLAHFELDEEDDSYDV